MFRQFARVHRIIRPVKYSTTGLIIGISGAGLYFLNTKTIHLETAVSADHQLQSKKGVDSKESKHPLKRIFLDKLRQHERTHIPEVGSGISRFDVVQVARYVCPSLTLTDVKAKSTSYSATTP